MLLNNIFIDLLSTFITTKKNAAIADITPPNIKNTALNTEHTNMCAIKMAIAALGSINIQ
jgi:hypothetical protein